MKETWDIIFRDTARFWVQFVFVPVVVIIGAFGNSLTIYILAKKQMRISSKVYLTALTLSDLLFLLFSFSMTWKHYDCMKSVLIYWKYLPYGLWITNAASSTSVWLTVAFTIERYSAICRPRLSKSLSSNMEKRAFVIATCVYIACFLLTTSTSFEWQVVVDNNPNHTITSNITIFDLENTTLGLNHWYRLIYRWFSTISFVFLPLFILAVGNFVLINAVHSSNKIRKSLVSCYTHRNQALKIRQKDQITINVIAIVVFFFICQLPAAIILIYTSMHTPLKDSVEENVLLGLGNLFHLLVAMNAECNFILYTAICDKYRHSFFRMFCLDSVFQRWYDNKQRRVSTLDILIVESQDEKIRKSQNLDEMMENVKLKNDGKQRAQRTKYFGRKLIETIKICTTCELLKRRKSMHRRST